MTGMLGVGVKRPGEASGMSSGKASGKIPVRPRAMPIPESEKKFVQAVAGYKAAALVKLSSMHKVPCSKAGCGSSLKLRYGPMEYSNGHNMFFGCASYRPGDVSESNCRGKYTLERFAKVLYKMLYMM
jgi:hypothetical protein